MTRFGRDVLNGGPSHDDLSGGRGRDELAGRTGDDAFLFRGPREGNDTITDLHGRVRDNDRIAINASASKGGLSGGGSLEENRLQPGAAVTSEDIRLI